MGKVNLCPELFCLGKIRKLRTVVHGNCLEYLAEERLSKVLTELLHRRIDRFAGLSGNADREVVLCFLFQQGQDNSLLAVALSNHCITFPVTDFQPGRSNGSINGMECCKRELRAALLRYKYSIS